MGHGYHGSKLGHEYQDGKTKVTDREYHVQKFAWWPVRGTFTKKRIWLTQYHVVHILYDDTGRPPLKGWSWDLIYTKNEYLMMLLRWGK